MATRTLEELNKLVDKQQKVIQMLKDVHDIQNLMGKYVYWHEVERDPEFPDTIYALKTPGVSAEVAAMGAYVGEEGIRRFFSPMPGIEPGAKTSRKGVLFTHPLATPVIEVTGDGKTAKGVWMSPGYEGGPGEPGGGFCYTKYGVDFAKEDGVWKVWHYHVYRVFMTPWNVPYTDEWEKNVREKQPMPEGMSGMEARKPDMPTTADNPYSTDTSRELVPEPPEPYETWSDTFSYGPPEK